MITWKVDADPMIKRIKRITENTEKRFTNDIKLAAKRMCFYAMQYTLPKSSKGQPWPMEKLKERIKGDIRTAYPSFEDENWAVRAFDLIEANYTEEKSKEWWHEYRSGTKSDPDNPTRIDAEEKFRRMRKIPRKIQDDKYQALRREDRYRRVPSKAKPMAFVDEARRKKYIAKRQRSAGLAKAGWYCAARAIGGQVNYTGSNSEEGRFVWPPEIRKVIGPFGGVSSLGGASISVNGMNGRFIVHNKVRHASEAMPDHLLDSAISNARNAMRILMEKRTRAAVREKGGPQP